VDALDELQRLRQPVRRACVGRHPATRAAFELSHTKRMTSLRSGDP